MKDKDPNHRVCSACRRLYDAITGLIVRGWERARHVSADPGKCWACVEAQKSLAASQ